jgi:predicted Ser/Thr protein kinase
MVEINSIISTNIGELKIVEFLGRGKSGYSYLAEFGNQKLVFKLMHNEENPYYKFDKNRVELELKSYEILESITSNIPKLIDYSIDKNYLVKEFIDGKLASNAIAENILQKVHLERLIKLAKECEGLNINIDYFPSNFVITKDEIFYIDYEVNEFMKEWSLENWGIYYWLNSKGFKMFIETDDSSFINSDVQKGIPHKVEFEEKAKMLFANFNGLK